MAAGLVGEGAGLTAVHAEPSNIGGEVGGRHTLVAGGGIGAGETEGGTGLAVEGVGTEVLSS